MSKHTGMLASADRHGMTGIALLAVITGLLTLAHLLTVLDVYTNDDVFVYYTYARNITLGRPFAYDVRNIPSEGFTSLLYLLLLTPFEALGVNLTFASTLLNLGALLGTVALAMLLLRRSGFLSGVGTLFFGALAWLLLSGDRSIRVSLSWGLETMFGPLVVVAAALALHYTYAEAAVTRSRALTAFFMLLMIAYLIRPESIAFIGVASAPFLLRPAVRWAAVRQGILFVAVFAAYHMLKLVIFGDVVPTGFYRKVGGDGGLKYVSDWFVTYRLLVILLGVSLLLLVLLRRKHPRGPLHWLGFFAGVSVLTLLFFTRSEPLVGQGFRFLMTPLVLLYLTLVALWCWCIERLLSTAALRRLAYTLVLLTLMLANSLPALLTAREGGLLHAMNIHARAQAATDAHQYLRFGSYLREHLPAPDEITLVFGDAGALPYALGGRFIDTNGLTEPALARLALLPDSPDKTQQYIDHILAHQPDMVVLAWGDAPDGIWESPVNIHSPFRGHIPLALYETYHAHGIVYTCSVRLYYDLHIGLRRTSPHYDALYEALTTYCAADGYVLPNGLTITEGGGSVRFVAE